MGSSCTVYSPAKVNLRLKVLGRTGAGYHTLSMVNLPIGFYDLIKIKRCKEPFLGFTAGSNFYLSNRGNLILRALDYLKSELGLDVSYQIIVHKSIPAGGGLGGGSSNAAAVIKALLREQRRDDMGKLLSSAEFLSHLAHSLGADIPFFLKNRCALVGGIGDRVEPLEGDFRGKPVVLILPEGVSSSTSEMFHCWDRVNSAFFSRGKRGDEILNSSQLSSWESLLNCVDNDFLPVFLEHNPSFSPLYNRLVKENRFIVSLSGTGSSFFVVESAGFQSTAAGLLEEVRKRTAGIKGVRYRLVGTTVL